MKFGNSTVPSITEAAEAALPPVEHAMHSARGVADRALDTLSGTVQDVREQVSPLLERAGAQASVLAQKGADAVRERSVLVREQALRASDGTLGFIKDQPVKAVLIATAAGAALMALVSWLRKSD